MFRTLPYHGSKRNLCSQLKTNFMKTGNIYSSIFFCETHKYFAYTVFQIKRI